MLAGFPSGGAEPEISNILHSCVYFNRTDPDSKRTALSVACLAVLYYEPGYLRMTAELQEMVFDNRLPCPLRLLALHGKSHLRYPHRDYGSHYLCHMDVNTARQLMEDVYQPLTG